MLMNKLQHSYERCACVIISVFQDLEELTVPVYEVYVIVICDFSELRWYAKRTKKSKSAESFNARAKLKLNE